MESELQGHHASLKLEVEKFRVDFAFLSNMVRAGLRSLNKDIAELKGVEHIGAPETFAMLVERCGQPAEQQSWHRESWSSRSSSLCSSSSSDLLQRVRKKSKDRAEEISQVLQEEFRYASDNEVDWIRKDVSLKDFYSRRSARKSDGKVASGVANRAAAAEGRE
mmetsp:Transcript_17330/g.32063  ORF Transcript_17330/g.32063 Transcript_17330/m.32063 type:complete len:164 (-) Transcript_17330:8-499(-)